MEGDKTLEQMREELRARGGRVTPQREIVLAALYKMPGHVTAEEVHEVVAADHPSINQSTVYRTLELLEELGLVYHSHVGHGSNSYHLASRGWHLHLVCQNCGVEIEADLESLEPVARELRTRYGFEPDFSHFAVVGVCADCKD
jgi:Fur family ferric uptake transcriptional regulator